MSESEHLGKALHHLQEAMLTTGGDTPSKSIKEKTDSAVGIVDKIKDNIAWVLGLPAAIAGSFGFLWESSNEEAALQYQVDQLTTAVADLKAENDLLGGGQKNFSLDMAGAPGGSMTVMIVGACLIVAIGVLVWYQRKRKRSR